jgi:hypothetical protein
LISFKHRPGIVSHLCNEQALASGEIAATGAPPVLGWQQEAQRQRCACLCVRQSSLRSADCSGKGEDHARNESGVDRCHPVREATEIVVFSGAGLSADSGIPTFRDGATGLWNNVDPDEVASIEGFLRNPQRVWNWLLQLKTLVDDRRPNAGHQAIARLEDLCAGTDG